MIFIKTDKEIKLIQEGGRKLRTILKKLLRKAKPGIVAKDLDNYAEELIIKAGGEPSFKTVKGYNWTTCICFNEEVVHGVPNNRIIKEGDLISIDIGMYYKNYHTDTAWTINIKEKKASSRYWITPQALAGGKSKNIIQNQKINRFLKIGEISLKKAILMAKVGNRIGHISKIIQEEIESAGFNVVKTLVGHGIGKELHEKPEIPCFLNTRIKKTTKISCGMVLAIEVMYTMGSDKVFLDKNNGWTIKTKDGKMSGHFEKTMAVSKDGPLVLTWKKFMHKGTFEVQGEVIETLPNTLFRVRINETDKEELKGKIILCHLSGKMRMHYIRVMPGDRARIEMTSYDLGKGRIVYRYK